MVVADPWYDYLALPIAPLVLLVQAAALFLSDRRLRWALELACPVAILAMLLYVAQLRTAPDEGANIGAGVLLLWLACSALLAGIAVAREAGGAVLRRRRAQRDVHG